MTSLAQLLLNALGLTVDDLPPAAKAKWQGLTSAQKQAVLDALVGKAQQQKSDKIKLAQFALLQAADEAGVS